MKTKVIPDNIIKSHGLIIKGGDRKAYRLGMGSRPISLLVGQRPTKAFDG